MTEKKAGRKKEREKEKRRILVWILELKMVACFWVQPRISELRKLMR